MIIEQTESFTSVDSTKTRIYAGSAPQQMVKIGRDNCYGVIVDEDTVLTVADCTNSRGYVRGLRREEFDVKGGSFAGFNQRS